jgi:uncharacterized protein (TIGR04141 family)
MATGGRQQRINIFLTKSNTSISEIIRGDVKGIKAHQIKPSFGLDGIIWARTAQANPPSWRSFVSEFTPDSLDYLSSKNSSALLIVKVKERLFCIVFGYARSWIKDEIIERRFGMIVTLNCVDRNKLRSVDREEFDTVTRTTRSQTSTMSGIESFGLDIQRDLVRSVTGQPKDAAFGSHVTGSDNLILTSKMKSSQLVDKCSRSLDLYAEKTYKEHFGWIDNFQRIVDAVLISDLEKRLEEEITQATNENVFISPPALVDVQDARVYRYPRERKTGDAHSDIRLDDLLEHVERSSLTIDRMKTLHIREFNLENNAETRSFSIYDALVYETTLDSKLCVLTHGEWFSVDQNYVKQVELLLASIEVGVTPVLPDSVTDEREEVYNLRVADASGGNLLCLDQKAVQYGGGRSKIEVCDLLSLQGDFVHVKAKTKSATLSHLFNQGLVSAQVMRDQEFRKLAREKCQGEHKSFFDVGVYDPSAHKIAFAIITTTKIEIKDALPFFSKQSLANAARELKNMGYGVNIRKIAVQPAVP